MSKRFGLAIVGLGMAAKPHALALQQLTHIIDVKGAFARTGESRKSFCDTYGFPTVENVNELAEDPSVDGLLLITPPNARSDLVSLFAGESKHILMEKPLERTTAAAEAIVEKCKANGVSLGVVFQHRFRAASEALAKLLSDGDLGDIRVVNVQVPWWRDQSYYDEPGRGTYERDGGGVLISQAIHTLDLMLSLTGPVKYVQAKCATTTFHRMEAEDFAAGALEFESGAVGTFFASTASFPGDAESIELDCDRGSALLKAGILTVNWREGTTQTFGEESSTGGGADPMAFPFEWHKSVIADFAQSIQAGRPPRVTGTQALDVHRLITAIEESSRIGKQTKITKG